MPAHLTSTPTTRAIRLGTKRWTVRHELSQAGDLVLTASSAGRKTWARVRFEWHFARDEFRSELVDTGGRVVARIDEPETLTLRNWRLDIKHGLWPKRG